MRRVAASLLLPAIVAACLAGCSASDKADQLGGRADRTRECADLLGELTGLDFDPQAGAAKLDQTARRLDQAIKGIDSADVKRAANQLLLRVRRLRDAVRKADPAQQRQAVRGVTQAAEQLARSCNVPVDQLTGQG